MTRIAKSKSGSTPTPSIPAIPQADVLGRLAALKTTETPDLKQQWRELFGAEPHQPAGEDVADLAEVRREVSIRMWQGHRGSAWISCHVIT